MQDPNQSNRGVKGGESKRDWFWNQSLSVNSFLVAQVLSNWKKIIEELSRWVHLSKTNGELTLRV